MKKSMKDQHELQVEGATVGGSGAPVGYGTPGGDWRPKPAAAAVAAVAATAASVSCLSTSSPFSVII